MNTNLPTPVPAIQPETRPFWEALANGQLLLQRCVNCGAVIWYPRAICPDCWSFHHEWFEASGNGTIYSYTINARGLGAFAETRDYAIAYVELDEGPRVLTNIEGCSNDNLRIGLPVSATFPSIDSQTALLRFRPITET